MPEPYRRIWENNGSNPNTPTFVLPDDLQSGNDTCAGFNILAAATMFKRMGQPRFRNLFKHYIEYGRDNRWRWNGVGGGWDRFGLLDGRRTTGECKLFVANLWLLARAPYPYGLGIRVADLRDVIQYEGGGGHGFVAEHNGTFFGLDANVSNAPGYRGVPLYLWANHKVLFYENLYWDACYGKRYENLQDMARYELTGRVFRLRNDTLANCTQTGDTVEEASHRGRIYYFRQHAREEEQHTRTRYVGPLTQEQAFSRHRFFQQ